MITIKTNQKKRGKIAKTRGCFEEEKKGGAGAAVAKIIFLKSDK